MKDTVREIAKRLIQSQGTNALRHALKMAKRFPEERLHWLAVADEIEVLWDKANYGGEP